MIKKILLTIFFITVFVGSLYPAGNRNGVFLWPATLCETGGIEKVIHTLRQNSITDVFLLVKGEDGATFFPSDYTYEDLYREKLQSEPKSQRYQRLFQCMQDSTLLERFIQRAREENIKVHAWFIVSGDRHFTENNPGAEAVHPQKSDKCAPPYPVIDKAHVNLSFPTYKDYFFTLVKKALELPFDGLMLDKIRYTHLVYTWDNIHLSKALRAGVDMNKVYDHALRTIYGNDDDKELFVYDYRDGDQDIASWIRLKKEDIEQYVKDGAKIAREKDIEFSAAFMPEGAYDVNFSDVYYGQNYKELSPYFDFIVIMAYAKDFRQPPAWVKMVVENAKLRSSCEIWAAVQGYGDVEDKLVFDQIKSARLADADGIAVFRYGAMNQQMWQSFAKGISVKLNKERKKQIKGIIFSGKGTIRNCWLKSAEALLLSDRIIPLLLNEDYLKDYSNFENKEFILIPGGGGSAEAEALAGNGLSNIEKFVSFGGGYIGICAGAYLPVQGYFGNLTEKLQIVNAAVLDIEHWNRGSGPAEIEVAVRHPIFKGIKAKTFTLNYFSGPVLIPANLDLPAYKELAVFRTDYHENGAQPGDMLGKTAILESRYEQGKIILFSPHPELTPGYEEMLVKTVIYVTGKN